LVRGAWSNALGDDADLAQALAFGLQGEEVTGCHPDRHRAPRGPESTLPARDLVAARGPRSTRRRPRIAARRPRGNLRQHRCSRSGGVSGATRPARPTAARSTGFIGLVQAAQQLPQISASGPGHGATPFRISSPPAGHQAQASWSVPTTGASKESFALRKARCWTWTMSGQRRPARRARMPSMAASRPASRRGR